jgi:hypothetical protein
MVFSSATLQEAFSDSLEQDGLVMLALKKSVAYSSYYCIPLIYNSLTYFSLDIETDSPSQHAALARLPF